MRLSPEALIHPLDSTTSSPAFNESQIINDAKFGDRIGKAEVRSPKHFTITQIRYQNDPCNLQSGPSTRLCVVLDPEGAPRPLDGPLQRLRRSFRASAPQKPSHVRENAPRLVSGPLTRWQKNGQRAPN